MRLYKPTYEEKQLMSANKLDWKNWLVKERDNISIAVVNKKSGKIRVLFR